MVRERELNRYPKMHVNTNSEWYTNNAHLCEVNRQSCVVYVTVSACALWRVVGMTVVRVQGLKQVE